MSTSSLLSSLFKGGVGSPKRYREYVVPEHVKNTRRFASNVTLGRTKEANDIILAIKSAKRRYLESQKNKASRKTLLRKLRKLSPVKSVSRRSREAVPEFKIPEPKAKSKRASKTKRASSPPKPIVSTRSERAARRSSAQNPSSVESSIQYYEQIVNMLEEQIKEYNKSAPQRMRTDATQGIIRRSLQDFNKEEINKSKDEIRTIRDELKSAQKKLKSLKTLKRTL